MSNAIKQIVAGQKPLSTDVDQFRQMLSGIADFGSLSLFQPIANPSAPTVSVNATSGVLNGAYLYKQVNVTGWVGSDGSFYVSGFAPSADSSSISPASQQVNVTLTTGPSGTIARLLYRTVAGGASGSEKFVTWIGDNTTTSFTDNVADASLGTGMPTSGSNPSVNGTSIPANVPSSNTTGTTLNGSGSMPSARNVELIGTSAQQIFTYTPANSGLYRVTSYLRVVTAATNVTLTISYTDSGGAQSYTPAALNNTSVAIGSHSVIDYTFEAVAGTSITLTVTAGTANQVYVSGSLEVA